MTKMSILRIALPTPLRRLFDYLPPQGVDIKALTPGIRIRVPFQSRTLIGILIEVVNESTIAYGKLKNALEVLDDQSVLTQDVYKICKWASEYYHYSLGEVLSNALPTLIRKGKLLTAPQTPGEDPLQVSSTTEPRLNLNPAQKNAINKIITPQNQFKVFLLDGVTGSGKTEVYLQTMEKILEAGKQVLMLVPEISLTPQTLDRFRARFSVPIIALHSGYTEKQRFTGWLAACTGEAKIVIGTRSAVFTPFANLGLIIVDEEHDPSFKQQDRFRYHARDVAVMRANLNQIPIVLGSATPSLESLLNVKRERYELLSLPERAGDAQLPSYDIVDVRNLQGDLGLSPKLLTAMHQHLNSGNQVMLFLNRRGFAPVLYCTQCAWVAGCKRCDTRMVYHQTPLRLQCHHCDSRSKIPETCGQCKQKSLQPVGIGTQRLHEALQSHFPTVPIIRVDRDSTQRKNAMEDLLKQIHTQDIAILLGTQMLAKGHHFPNVTLVGVVDADAGLFSADFRAAEQLGQLLLQVSGRAGRGEKPGTVMIQTHHPEHPLLQTLIHQGYSAFAQALLGERALATLPPYSHFAVFRAEGYIKQGATDFLTTIKSICETLTDSVTVLGPVSALIGKRKGLHCQHLLIKANQRNALRQLLQSLLQKIEELPQSRTIKWVLDVDPVEVI